MVYSCLLYRSVVEYQSPKLQVFSLIMCAGTLLSLSHKKRWQSWNNSAMGCLHAHWLVRARRTETIFDRILWKISLLFKIYLSMLYQMMCRENHRNMQSTNQWRRRKTHSRHVNKDKGESHWHTHTHIRCSLTWTNRTTADHRCSACSSSALTEIILKKKRYGDRAYYGDNSPLRCCDLHWPSSDS